MQSNQLYGLGTTFVFDGDRSHQVGGSQLGRTQLSGMDMEENEEWFATAGVKENGKRGKTALDRDEDGKGTHYRANQDRQIASRGKPLGAQTQSLSPTAA